MDIVCSADYQYVPVFWCVTVILQTGFKTSNFIAIYPKENASIYLMVLSQSFSDHHLRCGGCLKLEFSKGKTFGMGH